MSFKILVVCEGPTDFVFIKGIIDHLDTHLQKHFVVEMVSPQVDATTGHAEPHGWSGVKRWCELWAQKDPVALSHLPDLIKRAALSKNWEALLAASNADMLLVQLDTDIANEIDGTFVPSTETRRSFCERKLNMWLGINNVKPNCKYLLPTYAIENWLLATYDDANAPDVFCSIPPNYETIFDVEDRLIAIGYAKKKLNGRFRIRKSVERYRNNEKYLKRLISNLPISAARCQELSYFVNLIQTM